MRQLSEFMDMLAKHYPTPFMKNHYISTKKWNDNEVILFLWRQDSLTEEYFLSEVSVEAWNDKTPQQFIDDLLKGLPPIAITDS